MIKNQQLFYKYDNSSTYQQFDEIIDDFSLGDDSFNDVNADQSI